MSSAPPPMEPVVLSARPLTAAAFAPFGEVLSAAARPPEEINYGHTQKFADLARIDTSAGDGRTALHLYHSRPVSLPLNIEVVERHPLGSQAFYPLHSRPFLVVVAAAGDPPTAHDLHAFLTNGEQGINLYAGVWHHYQVTLDQPGRYLVIDRAGPGGNFDEHHLDPIGRIEALPA